jgi:hypothetical protein
MILLLFLIHGMKFRDVFSSTDWFAMEFLKFASIFVTWNGIPSICFFRVLIRNGIPRVCFNICSTVQNSGHFSLTRNGSERNSESFLFHAHKNITS